MGVTPRDDRRAFRAIGIVVAAFAAATVAAVVLVRLDVFRGSSATTPAGKTVAQARTLPPFGSVELAGSNNVSISVGKPQAVVVHADRDALRHVTTEVTGGSLIVGNTAGRIPTVHTMRVVITVPSLSALTLSGSGIISATNVNGGPLDVALRGTGIVNAAGSTTRLKVTLSGSGDANLQNLVAVDATAVLAGTGAIFVNVAHDLHASLPGTGTIVYIGHPKHLQTSITGSGSIVPPGL